MADELQALLDRIAQDGLQKSEARKEEILQQARQEAEKILSNAKAEAAKMIADATREPDVLRQKSEQALRLASRDVKLALRGELESLVPGAVKQLLNATLATEGLATVIANVCSAFLQANGQEADLSILVSAADLAILSENVKAMMAENLAARCELAPSKTLKGGFKLVIKSTDVVYDFSDEALTEALSEHLSPKLAAILAAEQA